MSTCRLVLASASPRRRELLRLLGVPFSVVATSAEEESEHPAPPELLTALPPCELPPAAHPTLLAWRKVVAAREQATAEVVLGADTVVALAGAPLNKPRNAAHAREMLARLSGQPHTVYTGMCVWAANRCGQQPPAPATTPAPRQFPAPAGSYLFDLVSSEVCFAPLSPDDIAAYVASGEPFDKAGAYGIQGEGGKLVRQVVGSFTAVVGLPLPATWRLLTAAGVEGLANPTSAYTHWLQTQGKEPLPCPPTLP